jgi:hypothetical protein
MNARRSVVLVALAASLGGCLPFRGDRSARDLIQSYSPFAASPAKDKAVLRTVLLDQPTGDPYLTTHLWATTLKPLPPETAALLAENGVRVGVFPSNPPAELLERIEAGEATVRPNETTAGLGEGKVLPINGPVPTAAFRSFADIGAEPTAFELANAQMGFHVTAAAGENGKLKLTFEPRAQHGERQGWLRPTIDGTGFAWLDQKEMDKFPKLAFEVAVTPGEFLVVGPTERPAGKLGGAWFVADANDGSRMRVLVVRAWRGANAPTPPVPGRKLAARK